MSNITKPFVFYVGQLIRDNKRNITVIELKRLSLYKSGSKKYIRYKCNVCGFESKFVLESDVVGKQIGCTSCRGLAVTVGYNDIPTTASWMVKYFQGGYEEAKKYTKGSKKTIHPICPDCGRISKKPMSVYRIHNEKSIGCTCGDGFSYPEKFMISLLNQLNITYDTEYSPNWIKPRRYDFYLPDYKLIIEMDGGFHNKTHTRSQLTIDEVRCVDKLKDELALENGLNIVRINAKESTVEHLTLQINSSLSFLFDFNNIDWDECNKFATKNIIKEVCEYYELHKPMSPKDVGAHFNIKRRQTINDYLNKGSKIGWCIYEKEMSNKLGGIIRGKQKSREIEVYKNNICVGIYPSLIELEKKSISDFGVKLLQSGISHASKRENNQYKGYEFKYIS